MITKEKALGQLCVKYADCQLCPYGANVFPDQAPFRVFYKGNPHARVFLIGEGPGAEEIKAGRPFIGRAGKLLNDILKYAGIPVADTFITNTFICSDDGKKKPTDAVLIACNDRLHTMIEIVQPKIIVCLGMYAHRALFSIDRQPPMKQYLDRPELCQFRGSGATITAFTEYHPAYLLRNPAAKKDAAPRWKRIGEAYKLTLTE